MQALKQCFSEAVAHPLFKPIAITTTIVVSIVLIILGIVFRNQLNTYFTKVIKDPEHNLIGVGILAGSSALLSLGLIFGIKKLAEKIFRNA